MVRLLARLRSDALLCKKLMRILSNCFKLQVIDFSRMFTREVPCAFDVHVCRFALAAQCHTFLYRFFVHALVLSQHARYI